MTTQPDKLVVTQEDFEAAVDTCRELANAKCRTVPGYKTHILEQAFARHRLQSAEAAARRALDRAARMVRSNAEKLRQGAESHADRKYREFAAGALLGTYDAIRSIDASDIGGEGER